MCIRDSGSPTLRFTHRTARVTIVLTDYTEGLPSVRLTGLSTEGGNPAEITPVSYTHLDVYKRQFIHSPWRYSHAFHGDYG